MFFQVDAAVCNEDGICVEACPARVLQMTSSGVAMVAGGEESCISCGHCSAVCPVAAVTLDLPGAAASQPRMDTVAFSAEQAECFLRSRRSIRVYRSRPLSQELLEKALAVASAAPTGSNRQPVHWLVFRDRKEVETVAAHVADWMRYVLATHPEVAASLNMAKIVADVECGIDRICRNAPHLIFAYADAASGVAAIDCHTALAYLELILPSLGGGSCWAGYVHFAASQWQPLVDFLALPEGYRLHGALMAGYPRFRHHRIPERNAPKIVYR